MGQCLTEVSDEYWDRNKESVKTRLQDESKIPFVGLETCESVNQLHRKFEDSRFWFGSSVSERRSQIVQSPGSDQVRNTFL